MNAFEHLTRKNAGQLRCIPAMPTVFLNNGLSLTDAPIDFGQQINLIKFLINGKVDSILADGTTGEAATQDHQEQIGFIRFTVETVNGLVPVIAGCGSNCTYEAIRLTKGAIEVGANAVLLVKPYYNKPGTAGLLAHFSKIAETGFPFITYSVSSRHGGGAIPIEVIAKLAEMFPHHIGHKEAEGKPERFKQLRNSCPDDFVIWSGDDGITAQVMAEGSCDGVISVAANVVPYEVKKMVDLFASNDPNQQTRAYLIESRLQKLFGSQGLFIQTNPQPVKTALEMMGIIRQACFRLPLVPMEKENPPDIDILRQILRDLNLLPS
jgi:4-hydroxy-tetrahydrodipicolinate synthase